MTGLDGLTLMPLADTSPQLPRTDAPSAPLQAMPGFGEAPAPAAFPIGGWQKRALRRIDDAQLDDIRHHGT